MQLVRPLRTEVQFRAGEEALRIEGSSRDDVHYYRRDRGRRAKRVAPNKNRYQERITETIREQNSTKKSIDGPPFLVLVLINKKTFTLVLVNIGYLLYGLISRRFATRNSLQRILITPRPINGFSTDVVSEIIDIAKIKINLDGYKEETFFYIVPNIVYDIILGLLQIKKNYIRVSPRNNCLYIGSPGL